MIIVISLSKLLQRETSICGHWTQVTELYSDISQISWSGDLAIAPIAAR